MRTAIAILVLGGACGDDGGAARDDAPRSDSAGSFDARIDASVDASIDAYVPDAYIPDAPPDANLTSVFGTDSSTLALLELNGDVLDTSGNNRAPTLLGGTFETTAWGMGLRMPAADPQGLDWSAYAALLTHPYTIEMVVTPDSVGCYGKLFSFDDTNDDGWYYCNGFRAYPNTAVTDTGITAATRHYFALVSTSETAIDVYFQGAMIGSTAASFTAPPTAAVFFRDDSDTARGERLTGIVEAVRISSVSRTAPEIAAIQAHLATRP